MYLHPFGALYWVEEKVLMLADVHIGKVAHFRREGLAVPAGLRHLNIQRLDKLVAQFQPERIIFLGDLFHSKKNSEWEDFKVWLQRQSAECMLILGNHDRHDKKAIPQDLLACYYSKDMGPFRLSHHPEDTQELFNICGHIHPGIMLRGRGGLSLKAACFAVYERQMILPAFGAFTGTHQLGIKDCKHLFVIAEEELVQVK